MTTDPAIPDGLADWLRGTIETQVVAPGLIDRVAAQVAATPQQRAWRSPRRATTSNLVHHRRSPVMFSLLRVIPVIVAASFVTLFVAWSIRSVPTGTPGSGAVASPSAGPVIAWDTGSVRLGASAMRISVGDQTFVGETADVALHSDTSDPTRTTLEAKWVEQGMEQRLYLYLASDGTDWWVSELRTYDGSCSPEWITYPGPLFRTPLGEVFQGDVRLTDGVGRARDGFQVTGSVEFDDLSIDPTVLRAVTVAPRASGLVDVAPVPGVAVPTPQGSGPGASPAPGAVSDCLPWR